MTEKGGFAVYVTKNREIMAPDFGFDKRIYQNVPGMLWLIDGKKDAPEFEYLMDNGSIGPTDLMEVFYS